MEQVVMDKFQMIGIEVRTSNQNGKAAQDIPGLWQRFMSQDVFQNIPNKTDEAKVYCVYMEYEGDHNAPYTTFIGCQVDSIDQIPEGMVAKNIRGGNYQKFHRNGKLSEIVIDQWMKIWDAGLARTYQEDYEVYENIAQDPETAEVDIFVGVE